MPSGTKYPKIVKEYTWQSMDMSDLKETKQAIVSYGLKFTISYGNGENMAFKQ